MTARSSSLNRRGFIKVSAGATASLLVSIYLPGCRAETDTALPPTLTPAPTAAAGIAPTLKPGQTPIAVDVPEADGPFEASAYLRIDPDGQITITVHRVEMGQGVRTALAMAAAEELEADWSRVKVVQADADSIYGNQVTGGSLTIEDSFLTFRRAGAAARLALIQAAAEAWGVDPATCIARESAVIHEETGSRLTYGELVGLVRESSAVTAPPLKDSSEFRIMGRRIARVDGPEIVQGKATYGIDVRLPDMLYAVVARSPVIGGQVAGYDDRATRAVAGVVEVVDLGYGVAVVGTNTWAALQGRKALDVRWDTGDYGDLSTADIRAALLARVEQEPAMVTAGGNVAESLTAIYEVPYLAHVTMEPMNGVVHYQGTRCEIWASTQSPQQAAFAAAQATGLPLDRVTLHVTQVGGGFGRRLKVDYIEEAARISFAVRAPVKVIWTREDDIRHDFYRPISVHSLGGGLDSSGMPVVWVHHIASYGQEDAEITYGAATRYKIPERTARSLQVPFPVPTGAWRAVFNTQDAFAIECFLDELAELGGHDPYTYRQALLGDRGLAVLDAAATNAGWGDPLPEGQGRGIATWSTWGRTPVAIVAEVSASPADWRVERVVCAVDCGQPINLDGIEAQMEGGIMDALAAMRQAITIENGQVQEGNFDSYRPLRIGEAPAVEVHIIDSHADPSGIGEMSGPPLVAAVANALYAATGVRQRRLPIMAAGEEDDAPD